MLNNTFVRIFKYVKMIQFDLQTLNNVNPFAQSDMLEIYLENLHAVIYAKCLTALFCFHQRGSSVVLPEHHLQDWK